MSFDELGIEYGTMSKQHVFKKLSLSEEFAIISFVVLLLGSLIMGWWVSRSIERGVIQQTAFTTTQFLDSFVSHLIGELSKTDRLNRTSITLLESFDQNSPAGKQVAYFNLWEKNGRLVYSSDLSKIGRDLSTRTELTNAWRDRISWDVIDPNNLDYSVFDRKKGDLIGIFCPIHQARSDRILAVAEIYLYTDALQAQIYRAKVQSWELVFAVTLSMFFLLYLFFRQISQTITTQQQLMKFQVMQLSDLINNNNELHKSVEQAQYRTTEINESFLRRISAELHDGPAQALGYTLLCLDSIFDKYSKELKDPTNESIIQKEKENLRTALADALDKIRNLASGMAMPELDNLNLKQVIQRVVSIHEQRSKTNVDLELDIELSQGQIALPLKIGIYRLIQEALTNAYLHGKGIKQRVQLKKNDEELVVIISDNGPGFDYPSDYSQDQHLGITGMKERVLSLSGHFEIQSTPGSGTKVIATFPISPGK
ncbi:MAG TPA: hypothetical protein ENJ32_12530 [Crenotrichaceae bacterium]|nr:hypothetical protein [Crenotrichaceae bacterium]